MESKPIEDEFEAEFKLILVGDDFVGKTSLVQRFNQRKTQEKRIGNSLFEIHSVYFETTYGKIKLNIWDMVSRKDGEPFPEDYYKEADCAFLMFDVTSRVSYKNIAQYHKIMDQFSPSIPTILVANKVEHKDRKIKLQLVQYYRKKNLLFWDISCHANYHIRDLFLALLRKLTNDLDLDLVKEPTFLEATSEIPASHIEVLEREKKRGMAYIEEDDEDEL